MKQLPASDSAVSRQSDAAESGAGVRARIVGVASAAVMVEDATGVSLAIAVGEACAIKVCVGCAVLVMGGDGVSVSVSVG